MILIFLACSLRSVVTGVVHPMENQLQLETMSGKQWRLSAAEEAFAALQDCTVQVAGPTLGRQLWVRDWRVVDSAFGPGIFVGVIKEWGAGLAIEDRNTHSTLAIVPEGARVLLPYLGEVVLLAGPIVGNRELRVVAFRVLTGPEAIKAQLSAPDEVLPRETPRDP